MAEKKTQMDVVTAEYDTVKDKHTMMQMALASAKDLLQMLLTGLAGTSAQSAGSGDYMGQIADAHVWLAVTTFPVTRSRHAYR